MKTMFNVSAWIIFSMMASSSCFAMMGIRQVSREEAKALGLQIHSQANGPGEVWVELEFKAEGKLRDFSHVNLEIRQGEQFLLGYAALRESRSESGSIKVGFMANRSYLDKILLYIIVGPPGNQSGYKLRRISSGPKPPEYPGVGWNSTTSCAVLPEYKNALLRCSLTMAVRAKV